jgi:preprotein translocase subunit SecE
VAQGTRRRIDRRTSIVLVVIAIVIVFLTAFWLLLPIRFA